MATQPDGFLALPAAGTGKPVLVLHAWWGLNDTFKSVCTRLAEAGFVAFTPDLYHGQVTDTIAGAEDLSSRLFDALDTARADVNTAAAYLWGLDAADGSSLAVVGFSMGAFLALDLSTRDSGVESVVMFYGAGPTDYQQSRAAYLGHFAESDPYEPQENVDALHEALVAAGRPLTFHTYPGTGHWFFEPDRADAYDGAAAALAWERTVAFLRRG
jgi:carboxymethylenebutenolidase